MAQDKIKIEYLKEAYTLRDYLFNRKELIEYDTNSRIGRRGRSDKEYEMGKRKEFALTETRITRQKQRLKKLANEARKIGCELGLEKLVEHYNLNEDEKFIFILLMWTEMDLHGHSRYYRYLSGTELLSLLGYKPYEFVEKIGMLSKNSSLRKNNLIEPDSRDNRTIFETQFCLTKVAIKSVFGDIEELNIRDAIGEEGTGLLEIREPVITFAEIYLAPHIREAIERVLCKAEKAKKLLAEWQIGGIIKYGRAISMLFYGPPGTGKTATCEAIAHKMGKKIGVANYATLMNKWFGESEKNIVRAFAEAKREGCILVFDEADSLFGKRLAESHSVDRAFNIMTNLLMQQLEWFDGIVILTTNRAVVMDEAFERRILLKLRFDIPSPEVRIKIWRSFFPDRIPLSTDVDFEVLAKRFELSGGHIKNVALKAIYECAFSGEPIKMADLIRLAEEEAQTVMKDGKALGFKAS